MQVGVTQLHTAHDLAVQEQRWNQFKLSSNICINALTTHGTEWPDRQSALQGVHLST